MFCCILLQTAPPRIKRAEHHSAPIDGCSEASRITLRSTFRWRGLHATKSGNPSAPHLPRTTQALPAYTRLDRKGVLSMSRSRAHFGARTDVFGTFDRRRRSSRCTKAPCQNIERRLRITGSEPHRSAAVSAERHRFRSVLRRRQPTTRFRKRWWEGRHGARRRTGSPSDPYPCRGVIWRRDRNTLIGKADLRVPADRVARARTAHLVWGRVYILIHSLRLRPRNLS